jgi:protein-disulfide isomerase
MTRLFKALAAGTLLSVALSGAPSAFALDEQQKKEMGEFIREYLIQNPEVMIEVQNALEAKQQAERTDQSTKAVAAYRDQIFSSSADVVLGNPKGDVTIVEFFDYNCGYCKRALGDMEEILANDKNVRFVLKEFPILGPDSLAAHKVAYAFHLIAPEKYAEFHRNLLIGQQHASEETALSVAAALGVDEAQIRKSMQEQPNDDNVRQAYQLANAIGITGTPTYIVGDEAVFGAVGQDELRERIENVRACGKAMC